MVNKVSEKPIDDEMSRFDKILFSIGYILSIIGFVILVIFLFFFGLTNVK